MHFHSQFIHEKYQSKKVYAIFLIVNIIPQFFIKNSIKKTLIIRKY